MMLRPLATRCLGANLSGTCRFRMVPRLARPVGTRPIIAAARPGTAPPIA